MAILPAFCRLCRLWKGLSAEGGIAEMEALPRFSARLMRLLTDC
jgi:hypothetical protein